jgi:hypothetical protein
MRASVKAFEPTLSARRTAHGEADFRSQFANSPISQPPQPAPRFDEAPLSNHSDVFGTSRRILCKTSLARGKKDVRGSILVNRCRQWHHQHCIGPLVTIPRIN